MHGEQEGEKTWGGRVCFPTTRGMASLALQTDSDMISWVPQGRTSSGLNTSWGGVPKQHVPLLLSPFSPTGQVDLDLLRCQQLKLYILKAGRALLSHQDQLRQILSQPAVQEAAAAHSGIFLRSSSGSVRKAYSNRKQARGMKGKIQMASACTRKMCSLASNWWKVVDKPEVIWWGGKETMFSCPSIWDVAWGPVALMTLKRNM